MKFPPIAPSPTVGKPPGLAHTIAIATIGNGLEWFDFTVYGFFSVTIAKLFFPTGDEFTSILLAVATFGAGFVVRPLGAVLLGGYADRRGRKAALTLAIALMTLGTGILGFAPTYAQVGIAGPILVLLARLVQGFSVGGEMAGSTAFLVEYAGPKRRGFIASWQQTSQAFAAVLGSVIGTLLTTLLTPEAVEAWGWRVPFIVGLLIGPVGFYIRARLDETPVFMKTEKSRAPLSDVLRHRFGGVASGFGVTVLWTVCTYVLLFYMPTYAIRILQISPQQAFLASTAGGVVLLAFCPLAGALSDRMGRKRLLLAASAAIGLLIYPLFSWLNGAADFGHLLVAQVLLGFLLAAFTGPAPALLAEQFPAAVRGIGLSLAYNFAVVIFGGFAALFVTWLIAATGSNLAPAYYVAFAAGVSFLTLLSMKDKTGQDIQ